MELQTIIFFLPFDNKLVIGKDNFTEDIET